MNIRAIQHSVPHRVGLAACSDYETHNVEAAFSRVLEPFGGDAALGSSGQKVLVKLNLLYPTSPERAVTTHPAVLEEVLKRLSDVGASAFVGDSPGGRATLGDVQKCWRKCGVEEICRRYGARLVVFEDEIVMKKAPGGMIREYALPALLDRVDRVIGVGKLKTHQFMAMTGAVKLHFGFIPGLTKPAMHVRIPEREKFARMLVELCHLVSPAFSILDGIVAMEGNGPGGGDPRNLGVLLGSDSPYALDYVAARLIGISNPLHVPTNASALELSLLKDPESIQVIGGRVDDLKCDDFKQIPREPMDILPVWARKFLRGIFIPSPALISSRCTGCGNCFEACQASSIIMNENKPVFRLKSCIRCYCCQEMCPHKAIVVKRGILARLTSRIFRLQG